jgi:hypothetical protein
LPLLWLSKRPGLLRDFALKISRRLRPVSGHGGLGVIEAVDRGAALDFQPAVYQIAKRFPGLDVDGPITGSLDDGIKGVNWLTILGDHWVNEMGGLDALRKSLNEDFEFYPYNGGLMIQAGPKPQAGDAQANRWPQHYVTLAKVLRPIFMKTVPDFHQFPGAKCMRAEESRAWVHRFDDK